MLGYASNARFSEGYMINIGAEIYINILNIKEGRKYMRNSNVDYIN